MNASFYRDSASRDNFRNARLLVIEDSPDHGVIIEKAIRHCLPEVKPILVTTEEEAMDFLNQCRLEEWELPKLILLDLYLPEAENGWSLLKQIKALPVALSKIPVVVLSSSASRDDIANAYDLGCSSYLVKPNGFDNWLIYFQTLRTYWWETVTLPKVSIDLF